MAPSGPKIFSSKSTSCVCHVLSRVRLFATPYPTRLLCPWNFPGKNTGVGCHFLFQGTFPTQGSNLRLLHCRQILYLLSHRFKLLISECLQKSQEGPGLWCVCVCVCESVGVRGRVGVEQRNSSGAFTRTTQPHKKS